MRKGSLTIKKLLSILLAAAMAAGVFGAFAGFAFAGSIDITNPSTSGWTAATPSTDSGGDTQHASADIVGDALNPSAFYQFSPDGLEIAVRIRVAGSDNGGMKNFAWIGLDVDGDGALDFFLGAYRPTENGNVAIYLADPAKANTSLATTGVTKPIAANQPVAGDNYSFIPAGTNIGGNGGDYFISFSFTLAEINAALVAAGRSDLQLSPDKPFSYIIGTSTQNNNIANGDINGPTGNPTGPWDFPPPISTDGAEYYTVTYDRTMGNRDASPRSISYKEPSANAGAAVDHFPATPPAKRDDSGMGTWVFDGWYYGTYDLNDDLITTMDSQNPNTDPEEVPVYGAKFTLGTVIKENTTLYAKWTYVPGEPPIQETTVHFNPSRGGGWTTPETTYRHAPTTDGIVATGDMPPNPVNLSIPTGGLGQGQIVFGGWVTTYQVYITNGQRANYPNIIDLTNNSLGNIGDVDFFVWSQLAGDLKTPAEAGYTGNALLNPYLQGHPNEIQVYAMWLIVNNNTPKINFYDNIYTTASPPAYGTLLYQIYGANGNKTNYSPTPPRRQGYTFAGWCADYTGNSGTIYEPYGNSATNPITGITLSGDMNLYALWVPAKYGMIFDPNTKDTLGDSLSSIPPLSFYEKLMIEHTSGLKYPVFPVTPGHSAPYLEGYEFLGWNTDPEGYGLWADDVLNPSRLISATGDMKFGLLDYPSDILRIENQIVEGYNKLYAIWNRLPIPEVDVNFNSNGGVFNSAGGGSTNLIQAQTTDDGKIRSNTYRDPTWEDLSGDTEYIFRGWSFTKPADWMGLGGSPDLVNNNIIFDPWDPGNPIANGTKTWQDWVDVSDATGHVFFPTSPDCVHTCTGCSDPCNCTPGECGCPDSTYTFTLYAVWEKVPPPYKVIFWPIGGEWPNGSTAPIEVWTDAEGYVLYTPNNNPVSTEDPPLDFLEWNLSPDGSGLRLRTDMSIPAFGDPNTRTLNVYAKWQLPPDTVTVAFAMNDGSGELHKDSSGDDHYYIIDKGTKLGDNGIAVPDNPVWGGREFLGWYTTPGNDPSKPGIAWDFGTMEFDDNTTLYARWAEGVTVTFYLNDPDPGSVLDPIYDEIVVPEGEKISQLPTPPELPGYVFRGWYTDPDWAQGTLWDFENDGFDEDTDLFARWEPKSGAFCFTKVGADDVNTPLEGATFVLYKLDEECEHGGSAYEHGEVTAANKSCWILIDSITTTVTGADDDGLVDFGELEEGVYNLVETQAPDGYELPRGQWRIDVDEFGVFSISSVPGTYPPAVLKETVDEEDFYYFLNMKKLIIPPAGGAKIYLAILGVICLGAAACLLPEKTGKKRRWDPAAEM